MIFPQKNSTILVFSIITFFLLSSFVCSFYTRKSHKFFGVAVGIENVPSSSLMNERQFLIILNKARKDSLLEPLMIDKDLSRAARYHSYDMGTQNYFGHDTYDRNIITDSLEFVCDEHARTKNFLKYESENKVWKVSAGVSENCNYGAASEKKHLCLGLILRLIVKICLTLTIVWWELGISIFQVLKNHTAGLLILADSFIE